MARIFTIEFQFDGAKHAAVVSTWKGENYGDNVQVALYDKALQHLVPDGVIRFSTTDENPWQKDTASDELVGCVKKAVKNYLQNLPV
jgi:hypothetical protein